MKNTIPESKLESYFQKFRKETIGLDEYFETPYGKIKQVYADWIATGRLYRPIEEKMIFELGKYVGNTHTETTTTGSVMTLSYHQARKIIKQHVNASENDLLINACSGMTGVVNKFQRILGLKICERLEPFTHIPDEVRPVIFISHMEHHSNHTSWLETIGDVVIIPPDEEGLIDENKYIDLLEQYKNRKNIITTITAASNVTGIQPDVHRLAKITHEYGGLFFVDYACAAPYVKINMHPQDPAEKLDAIYFSPHKFLGGPGSPGILIFDRELYHNKIPDAPGGGTVSWTNAWNERHYFDDPELREDGGTPPFLQTIKAAFAIQLKEEMGVDNILKREKELLDIVFPRLKEIPGLHILAEQHSHRLGVISFYIENLHYNLAVKLLDHRFGIQTRGGCSCAGTYGHYLLNISYENSKRITEKIDRGDYSEKPGWIRLSLHPVMTNEEAFYIVDAIAELSRHHMEWEKDYLYDYHSNEFYHKDYGNQLENSLANQLVKL